MRRKPKHSANRGDRCSLALVATAAIGLGVVAAAALVDRAQRNAALQRSSDLACLAENVYFEARGEPLVGQYAVAEVTMNRVASPSFPDTVCAVVHAGRFVSERGRYVGAFSWTENGALLAPYGYEWRRAQAVAATVYDNSREAPLVNGALFYHATRVTPDWARAKVQVARIGQHLFYE